LYSSQQFQDSDLSEPPQDEVFFILDQLQKKVEKYAKPNGTRGYPAKTCKDLILDYPHYKTGMYWIDPNGGAKEDAVLALCDFKKHTTCIKPSKTTLIPKLDPNNHEKYRYVTESDDMGEEIEYTANPIQMNFLRLYSTRGHQNITYHCLKSVAFNQKDSIKLKSVNEMDYNMKSKLSLRPKILQNTCNGEDSYWRKTVLELQNKKVLPIVDVAVFDVHKRDQKFKLEIGPVCFA